MFGNVILDVVEKVNSIFGKGWKILSFIIEFNYLLKYIQAIHIVATKLFTCQAEEILGTFLSSLKIAKLCIFTK